MEDLIRSLTAGMTTAKWKTIPIETIEIAALNPIQERGRKHTKGHISTGDIALYCVVYNGKIYIEDGHNRYYRAVDRRDLTIPVRCYNVLVTLEKTSRTIKTS